MAKQIYIDENGNEQLVSGTINTADMLPIQSGSATNTKDYIDTGLSGKAKRGWTYVDTIVDGGGGCDLSGYSEVLIVPYANNNSKYNSFVYPIQEIDGAVISLVGSTTHKYVGAFSLDSSNILRITNASITVWNSCYMRVWGK